MNVEEIKQLYGSIGGYICCDDCPIEKAGHSGLGFCPKDFTGYQNAWEAILKFLNREDDSVNHPSHYNDGKIEVMDFIEDKQLNFARGNVIKYVSRAGKKDSNKELEDLKKASWYLNREIERLNKEEE